MKLSKILPFLLAAMLSGFCITAEYAIIKPTSHSTFIAKYGTGFFPYAWLALLPLNFYFVKIYGQIVHKWGCMRTLLSTTLLSVAINLFSAFFLNKLFFLPFLLYIWKDVYILLLFQQLWAIIHSTDLGGRQKSLYGILFGVSGMGTALSSLIPGYFAVNIGSDKLLLLAIPFSLALTASYALLLKTRKKLSDGNLDIAPKKEPPKGGWKLLFESKTLKGILALVVFMQISATLMEFHFHTHIQEAIPDPDLRTAYFGKLFSVISSISLFFHFIGTHFFVKFFGVQRAHQFVPLFLSVNMFSLILFPRFSLISYNYGAIKSFDYSFFAIVKEMLYIPLTTEEKFQAKAIIDVFAYRSSKAVASFIVLLFPASLLHLSLMTLFALWSVMVMTYLKPKTIQNYV
ncbi:MAG: Npt1/Npt2 family nucleotide transporter [Simkaniaceae bacterium]